MEITFCNSFIGKLRGLMFTRKSDRALVFSFAREKRAVLHMFFVFYPIDVIYLNSAKVIVEMKIYLRPFHLYFPRNKARYVVELPAGYIQEHLLAVGETFDQTG